MKRAERKPQQRVDTFNSAIATAIADRLLINGAEQVGDRLVLVDKDGKDLGGWCKGAIMDQIDIKLAELRNLLT